MADNKATTTSGEEAKRADPVSDTTTEAQHSGDNKKTEDTPVASDPTSQAQKPPTRHLPTHYKGMPNQWEKNRLPKKDA
ncbi:hypothetical protein Hte_008194 [Hypoxylon texense]